MRLILCGYFLGKGEVLRKKDFFSSCQGVASDGNCGFLLVNNSIVRDDFELSYLVCPEYAYKFKIRHLFGNRLIQMLGFFLSAPFFNRSQFANSEVWTDLISAERYFNKSMKRGCRGNGLLNVFLFWLGMKYLCWATYQVPIRRGDVLVTWGDVATLHQLLRLKAQSVGAKTVIAEYGELQSCFFLSEQGMFHESWPVIESDDFNRLPLDGNAVERARAWRIELTTKRISNKQATGSLRGLDDWIGGRKVVFVPGLAQVGSGLYPRDTARSKEISPFFESNSDLALRVREVAIREGYCVLYKDHPNTFRYYPELLEKLTDDDHLKTLDDVDIHDALDRASVCVSLGGKSTLVALMKGVPVVLAGPFTLSGSGLVDELSSADDLGPAIRRAAQSQVDFEAMDAFNARLMQYWLFGLDDTSESIYRRGPKEAVDCLLDFSSDNRRRVSIPDDAWSEGE